MAVMPIWIVDRKRVGCSPSSIATAAARSPSAASLARRVRRAVTRAISDIANSPFRTIRLASSRISMRVVRRRNTRERRGVERTRQGTRTRRTAHDTRARRARLPCYGVAFDSITDSTHACTAASSAMLPVNMRDGTCGSLLPRGRPSHTLRGTTASVLRCDTIVIANVHVACVGAGGEAEMRGRPGTSTSESMKSRHALKQARIGDDRDAPGEVPRLDAQLAHERRRERGAAGLLDPWLAFRQREAHACGILFRELRRGMIRSAHRHAWRAQFARVGRSSVTTRASAHARAARVRSWPGVASSPPVSASKSCSPSALLPPPLPRRSNTTSFASASVASCAATPVDLAQPVGAHVEGGHAHPVPPSPRSSTVKAACRGARAVPRISAVERDGVDRLPSMRERALLAARHLHRAARGHAATGDPALVDGEVVGKSLPNLQEVGATVHPRRDVPDQQVERRSAVALQDRRADRRQRHRPRRLRVRHDQPAAVEPRDPAGPARRVVPGTVERQVPVAEACDVVAHHARVLGLGAHLRGQRPRL